MKKAKKLFSLALSMLMLGSTVPMTAFAQERALSNGEALNHIYDSLPVSENGEYATVYYGGMPWKVLDREFSDGQEDGKTGYYLLSEYVYGYGTYWNAHYGPGDYVWNRTGIYTRLDVQHHPEGYNGDPGNTSPTNLGYQESDIRKYMTGIGDYEAVYPRSMHEHGNPDNSGLNVSSYFWKTKVDYDTPIEGVVYYTKGEFRLSNHEFNNYKTLAVTAEDWLPDTWYIYDAATGEYNLVEEAPAEGVTLTCYHDASEYYQVGELTAFEEGVDYYTFEKIAAGSDKWEYTKLEMQANSIAKGALYCAFTVTDMKNSTSADAEGEGRVILSGKNNRNFADDMGFTDAEKAAVLPVYRKGATNGGAKTPSLWTYKNSGAYSDEFVGDTYFLPTAADLNTYLDDKGISKAATFANGDSAQYWLSSMLRYDRVGMVDGGGGEWYQHPTFKSLGIRPAFVLNPEKVAGYKPVEGQDNAYTLVLKDEAHDFDLVSAERNGNTLTIEYTGETAGSNVQLSYVLKDKVTGEIVKYGKLLDFNQVARTRSITKTLDIDISHIDTFNYDMYIFTESVTGDQYASSYASQMEKIEYSLSTYNLSLTADKTALKATENVNVSVAIDKAYYAAEYTFTYDTSKFVCSMDNDGDGVIFVGNLYQGEAGVLATYTLTAKDDIQSVYEGEAFSVSANVIEYKEQIFGAVENVVVGDTETVKVSLNYTASVKTDFVQGYSLVLVNGDHEGYAYNGVKMFYVEAYGAYAILVEGTVTAEGIDVALSKATGCETIRQSYNVNGEYVADGIVDIKDATAVYACSIIDFDVVEYMELYLRADVNGDCKVNMVDINAVVRNYTR